MNALPLSVRIALRRLTRRLALGLFLEVWPPWAAASLLAAAVAAVVSRVFFPGAAAGLPWLWLAPLVALMPAIAICAARAYGRAQVVALADSLTGGQGLLLALAERNDPAWSESPLLDRVAAMALPRLRPWRRLAVIVPAGACLGLALLLPQRHPSGGTSVLADHIASELTATLVALKKQELITPGEEKKLEEEIERIRRDARDRVDASSWEAADTLRERLAATLSEKQDAVKWAQESLARYATAAQAGGADPSGRESSALSGAELQDALRKLAESGLLSGAPADLTGMAQGRVSIPTDAESLRRLSASLAEYLRGRSSRFGDLAALGKEFGRFDPSEFPLEFDPAGPDGDGDPGRGGINRGRGDAPLVWGKETLPFDRFKAQALPPGFVRNPDDWAPIVELPGAPREAPELSASAAARAYAAGAGQGAWRRTLAPRHQRAVRKYFEK